MGNNLLRETYHILQVNANGAPPSYWSGKFVFRSMRMARSLSSRIVMEAMESGELHKATEVSKEEWEDKENESICKNFLEYYPHARLVEVTATFEVVRR